MYTEEQKEWFETLKSCLEQSNQVCPPDQYQLRINNLTKMIGAFLMAGFIPQEK